LLLEIPICGGHDPDIRADGFRTAQPLKLAFLKNPQELGLEFQRQLTDFIEK